MLPFNLIIQIDKTAKTPVFLQIAGALTDHIRRGTLAPGTRLPGTRALAEQLDLHRKTIVAAYDELLAQGWLETQYSKGTFVSHKLPEIQPGLLGTVTPDVQKDRRKPGFTFSPDPLLAFPPFKNPDQLAFNDGFPDMRLAPWEALTQAYRRVLRQGIRKNLLSYGDTYGEYSLRAAMTDYLRETRGLPIGIENVMLTRGSMNAMFLAVHSILQPGEVMIVGELSYSSGNLMFQNAGAQLLRVPVDAFGIDVDAIEQICRKRPVRIVYVTPHHHYPTTVIMPAERRLRLLQLAAQYEFCILEDDYDFDFHYDSNPILPLAGADQGNHVVYVGSLSKVFSPALRLGYVVAPAEVIEALANFRRVVDRQGDNVLEASLALLFKEGDMRRHLKKAQKTYHKRRDYFCGLLRSELGNYIEFDRPSGGLAVWARYDRRISLPELSQRCRQKGLWISDGLFYAPNLNSSRMGYAGVDELEIDKGLDILKNILNNW